MVRGIFMKRIINFILGFYLVFCYSVNARAFVKETNLVDIIVFEDFEYKSLKDEFLKQAGIDTNYLTISNNAQKEITESNYKELVTNFHNELVYEYKDVFGKKMSKTRNIYIFCESDFRESISLDQKYKIKNISVDIIYNDTSANKMLVGKIYTSPKLEEDKDCYIVKLDRNNKIVWGKMFEDSKINRFNKIIGVSEDEYCIIGSGYRESEWTDGFISKFDGLGNFHWKEFYGSSHIDDFKDIIALEDGNIIVLAEVSNQDGDVKTPISINNPLNKDLVVIKYDRNGDIIWQNSITNEKDLLGLKIINNCDNLVVVGEIFNYNSKDDERNIILSTFDLNGKMKFYTVINDYDENTLNKLI